MDSIVGVRTMVFGNQGDTSGSGVAFSRDEITGAPQPSGDFLVNAQGEDVVSGVRNTRDLAELAEIMPAAHTQLIDILRTLERHYGDMQDTEFTVQDGRLYMLQTRSGITENVVLALIGTVSFLVALKSPGWAGWVYVAIGPLLWIHGSIYGKRMSALAEKLPSAS